MPCRPSPSPCTLIASSDAHFQYDGGRQSQRSAAVGDTFSAPIQVVDSGGATHDTLTVDFTNTAPLDMEVLT